MSEEEKQDVVASEEKNNESSDPKLPTGEVGQEVSVDGVTNPEALKEVALDNEMKSWFVNYVGNKHKPEDGVVTVAMSIATMAEEFPEFLMVLAEENWVRGYAQGVADSEEGVKQALQQAGLEAPEQLIAPEAQADSEGEEQSDSDDE